MTLKTFKCLVLCLALCYGFRKHFNGKQGSAVHHEKFLMERYRQDILQVTNVIESINSDASKFWKNIRKGLAILTILPLLCCGGMPAHGDDELAKYAAEGNKVGVDGQCFLKKCAIETSLCANEPTCLKGLSCLARYDIFKQ